MAPNEGIGRVLTIHRFGHQLAGHQSSGRASTAKFYGFAVRVFLDRSPRPEIPNISVILGQKWGGYGNGVGIWVGRGRGSGR